MPYRITVLPQKQNIQANEGESLLEVLRRAGFIQDAPCGGNGACGKCKVTVDGEEKLACQTPTDRDMTVAIPPRQQITILTDGIVNELPADSGVSLAIDIGTTTVAAYLLENGRVLATESHKNPQAAFGADVVTRLRHAAQGQEKALTSAIRNCVTEITQSLLDRTNQTHLDTVCMVGTPPCSSCSWASPQKIL